MAVFEVPATSHAPAGAEPDSFPWFGEEIRIAPEFGELVWTDWVEEFGWLDADHPSAIAAGKELMRRMILAEDFDRFWAKALEHRQSNADMSGVLRAVLAGIAGRPTQRSAESSDGPGPNVDESKVAFLRRVSAGRPEIEAGLVELAIAKGELTG